MAAKNGSSDEMAEIALEPIEDLKPDRNNPNKHTPRGKKMLKTSLKKFGAGRSILLDADNRVISGNATLEQAKSLGYKRVMVVDSDGDTLVAVRRKDLKLEGEDKKARELALFENRTQEVDLAWDKEVLATTDVELNDLFEPIELDNLLNEGKGRKRIDKIDLQPPPKMIWILLGVPFNRFDVIQAPLAKIEAEAEISVQQSRNAEDEPEVQQR
jgi:hypothetical protein